MSDSALADRYAKALFATTSDKKATEPVMNDLIELRVLLSQSDDFRRFLANPILDESVIFSGLEKITKKYKFHKETLNLLRVLIANKRLRSLSTIAEKFKERVLESQKILFAHVTTAQELTEKQVTNLQSSLEKATSQKISLDATVDASILGGMIVRFGSRMVDASISNKLRQVRSRALESIRYLEN